MQYFGPTVNVPFCCRFNAATKSSLTPRISVLAVGVSLGLLGAIADFDPVIASEGSDPGRTYNASDSFQYQSFGPPPTVPGVQNGGFSAHPLPTAGSLLPVPLEGIPTANTPWIPGREAPDPLAPIASPNIGGPFLSDAGTTAAPMVIVIPNASTLPPEILAWLAQYQQGNTALPYGSYAQPTYAQPTYAQPTYPQPTYPQPTYAQPTYAQPTYPTGAALGANYGANYGANLGYAAPSPWGQPTYPTVPYPTPQLYAQPSAQPIAPLPQIPQTYGNTGPVPTPVWPSAPSNRPTVPGVPPFSTGAPAPQVPIQPQVPAIPPAPLPQAQAAPEVFDVSPRRLPIGEPSLTLQGGAILLDEEFSGRARLSGVYPISPDIALAGAIEVSEGTIFSDSELEGVNINELHLTLAPRDVPNLRFSVGHLDLTSYFDRNSFAKDALTHFFAPELQSNPALASNGLGSRTGALLNYAITDNVDARASLFSSDRSISEFDLSGFAGELGLRTGNAIIRGTYISAIDGGANDGPNEIFGFVRDDGSVGIAEGDREESLGINAEVFIPELNMGIFGRYGRYENQDADLTADTFSGGINFLDVFRTDDRLGLGYGRGLSNDGERRSQGEEVPDVWELFYDFRISPNVRAGVTIQQLNEFTETVAGVRLKTEFDVVP